MTVVKPFKEAAPNVLPQHLTAPPMRTAQAWCSPPETERTGWFGSTLVTGIVPSPGPPATPPSSDPQQYNSSLIVIAQVKSSPLLTVRHTRSLVIRDGRVIAYAVSSGLDWPEKLAPQQKISLVTASAQVCIRPAESCFQMVGLSTRSGYGWSRRVAGAWKGSRT